jgi:hypothetical protein
MLEIEKVGGRKLGEMGIFDGSVEDEGVKC